MPQVKNKLTGMVLNIPDSEIGNMSSQWEVVGGASSGGVDPSDVSGWSINPNRSTTSGASASDALRGISMGELTTQDQVNNAMSNGNSGNAGTTETADLMIHVNSELRRFLDELQRRGKTINPNIEITPEKAAEFLAQAQSEINPYYTGQLSLAREGFLRSVGYSAEQIANQEKEWAKKYKQNVRTIGTNTAETGMVLSGSRNLEEQNLAQDTQSQIDQARRSASYQAGTSARQFAQEWGGTNMPASTNIMSAPRVLAGQESWGTDSNTNPFYELDPSIYDGLVGTQQWNQKAQEKSRASELESAFRTSESLRQARSLNL